MGLEHEISLYINYQLDALIISQCIKLVIIVNS